MDDNVLKVLLALFALISSLGLAWIGYLTQRANRAAMAALNQSVANNELGQATHASVSRMEVNVNGNLAKLLATTAAAEYSRGVLSARSDEDARTVHVAQALAAATPATGASGATDRMGERLAIALAALPVDAPVTGAQLAQVVLALWLGGVRPAGD